MREKIFLFILLSYVPAFYGSGQPVNHPKSGVSVSGCLDDWTGTSNLPIVVITTPGGQDIPDDPKITADMKIIFNGNGQVNNIADPGNIYSGKIGIEVRGHYSAVLPQKPYGLETRDAAGNNRNVIILDMPRENDWILTANYNDKTFLRNFLAFEIYRKMGHYAPRTRYCEVVLNNEYQGIYLFGEKIKQDSGRINIAKLKPDENSGNDLTGGYIFSNDYYDETNSWISKYSPLNRPGAEVAFVYYDPEPGQLSSTQKKYLKDYVDAFENVLYSSDFKNRSTGYRAYIDVNSFVDYFLIGEVSRNVDAYKKSRFYYKDKDSKSFLIHSGPPWDMDWAWKDITEDCIHFDQTDGSGWAYRVADCVDWPVPPSWEVRLMQDSDFANRIYSRYFSLRKTFLSQEYLDQAIDSVANLLDEAQNRHYQKWPILGINVGTGEYGEQPDSYAGEIVKFKSWISRRLDWLDANMVGEATGINESTEVI
ncbi:MAG: CotH kinase family protein, partial [Bacteroidota bacterium]|nr:CotH kinase family protein [Bacteroidota bacterium]